MMGGVYPELRERASLINKTCLDEETRFRETLDRGVRILTESSMAGAREKAVPGELAFKLYDTYGFPLDLTRVIADEHAWTVDEAGFERAMDEQRKRSEFQGSGEVAVEGVFQAIADRGRRDQVPRLRGDRRQVQDRRAGRRRPGDERGRPLFEERRGRHRRDAVLRRAGRPDGRHRHAGVGPATAAKMIVRDTQAPGVDAVGPPRRGRSRASCASATRSTWPSTPSGATTSAATTRRRTCCTGRCATCWARTSRRRARWSRPIACASTSRTRRR